MDDSKPAANWTADQVLRWLKLHAAPANIDGMGRFGIQTDAALGIPNAVLRPLSRQIKRDHDRAAALWASGIREARLLACFTDEPRMVTTEQAWHWASEFNSWEMVDHAASLFVEAELHDALIEPLVTDQREFVRRTGFAMMAWGAVHLKKQPDSVMEAWLPLIEQHAGDGRNFVKKAVSWALRQIGKRSLNLHPKALALAQRLAEDQDKAARWVGRDAARELASQKTIDRLHARGRTRPGH